MQRIQKKRSTGKIIAAFLFVLLIAIIGGGLYAWNEFLKINAVNSVGKTIIKESSGGEVVQAATNTCKTGEDTAASSGMFCSQDMGIKIFLPKLFVGNMAEVGNYQVYQGSLNPNTKTPAGTSLHVYSATGTSGGKFTLTIAQEPMRSGYIDLYHAQQNTYFDAVTKTLSSVNAPNSQVNAATGQTKVTGAYTKGEPIPAFTTGTNRFYEGSSGEAGSTETTYMIVVNEKIIKISIDSKLATGAAAEKNAKDVYKEIEKSLRTLQTL